jgi:hypothetical protein
MGGRKPRAIAGEYAAFLERRVRDGAFTLRGLVGELAERGVKVDYRSMWNFVHGEKLSFKKAVVASERDRPDVARRRAQWTQRQSGIDPKRLAFIDEMWTKTNIEPLRGGAPKGERLVAKVPHGHWQTMTFVAALRHDRIETPWLIDGPIDGESFRPISKRRWRRRSSRATWWSWTISAATRARRSAKPSAQPERSCSFSPNTRRI